MLFSKENDSKDLSTVKFDEGLVIIWGKNNYK